MKLTAPATAPAASQPFQLVLRDVESSKEFPVPYSMASTSEDNGVPQGFRQLLINSTEKLWLTITAPPPPTRSHRHHRHRPKARTVNPNRSPSMSGRPHENVKCQDVTLNNSLLVLRDVASSKEFPVRHSMASTSEDNGVPQGFRQFLINSTDQLWLTVTAPPPLTPATAVTEPKPAQ